MHAYTEGETGTDSSRQQQLSAYRELHRLPAADRDSQRERQAAAYRERDTDRDRQTRAVEAEIQAARDRESERYIERHIYI